MPTRRAWGLGVMDRVVADKPDRLGGYPQSQLDGSVKLRTGFGVADRCGGKDRVDLSQRSQRLADSRQALIKIRGDTDSHAPASDLRQGLGDIHINGPAARIGKMFPKLFEQRASLVWGEPEDVRDDGQPTSPFAILVGWTRVGMVSQGCCKARPNLLGSELEAMLSTHFRINFRGGWSGMNQRSDRIKQDNLRPRGSLSRDGFILQVEWLTTGTETMARIGKANLSMPQKRFTLAVCSSFRTIFHFILAMGRRRCWPWEPSESPTAFSTRQSFRRSASFCP